MKLRDLIKQLEAAGFVKIRDDGKHSIYKAENKELFKSQDTEK
ncbi:MAG: type II toxin-antitoxin system HicA family toxin [Eubacteriales bacterium]|jgi:predicted RNA binding protein YcfA (HicA-like mRNA interferase family)